MIPTLPIIIRDKRTEERLLEALARGWSISYALRVSGMGRAYFEKLCHDDLTFQHAVTGAVNEGKDWKLDAAKQRAFDGYEKPVFFKGIQCGSEWKASDALALAILRADRPEFAKQPAAPGAVTQVNVSTGGGPGGGGDNLGKVKPQDRAKAVAALLAGTSAAELAAVLGG